MRIDHRWALLGLLLLAGCDDGAEASPANRCDAETNSWEYCVEDVVEWCHVGGDADGGHFHQGRNCAGEGLVCVAGPDHLGYCAAADAACAEGDSGQCVDGDAVNCVEGLLGARRCTVGKACEVIDGWATCVQL